MTFLSLSRAECNKKFRILCFAGSFEPWEKWVFDGFSFDPKTGLLTGSNDMNLVNLFLRWFGRCSEQQLCIRLLLFQV